MGGARAAVAECVNLGRMQGRTRPEITTQRRRGLVAGLIALYATIGGAAGAADPRPAQRAEFKQAWLRASSPASAAAQDSGDLRRYVLFPYLEAARLKSALRTPTSENASAAGSTSCCVHPCPPG